MNIESKVYEECKIYGPYKSRKDGRLRCQVIFPNKKTKILSYPKYLMEVHLNRYLNDDETIDHIDGDFLNNSIENLRIIDRKEHAINDAIRNKDVTVVCAYCGKVFTIKGSKIHYRNRKDKHQSGYFCSRQCTGKYGADVQNGRIIPYKVDKIEAEKYSLHEY